MSEHPERLSPIRYGYGHGAVGGGVLACRAPLRDTSALRCRTCNGVRQADTLHSGCVKVALKVKRYFMGEVV